MNRLLALGMVALVLAGCAAPGAVAPVEGEGSASDNVSRQAMPDGREGSFAAFNETNATESGTGGVDHAHDLWQGRDRATILTGTFAFSGCCYQTTPMTVAPLALPEGGLVFEGTAAVEVLLSEPTRRVCTRVSDQDGRMCNDRVADLPALDAPARVRLEFVDGVSDSWQDGGAVTWGTPMRLDIDDPRRTDMPHATYTMWGFRLVSEDHVDDGVRFKARVDIVRSAELEIPRWPGHPEFYTEARSRTVLATQHTTRESGAMVLVDPGSSELSFARPEKLVSYGTQSIRVWANITDLKVDNPAASVATWVLVLHNASGERVVAYEKFAGDERELSWLLPVSPDGMDGPYASGSRWGFLIRGVFSSGVPGTLSFECTGACTQYEVTYDLTVHATDMAIPKPPTA